METIATYIKTRNFLLQIITAITYTWFKTKINFEKATIITNLTFCGQKCQFDCDAIFLHTVIIIGNNSNKNNE